MHANSALRTRPHEPMHPNIPNYLKLENSYWKLENSYGKWKIVN